MLSKEEKKIIREEESYKFELRKYFEKKNEKTWKEKLWLFLNSAFGLWLLSTIVFSIIVNSYANFKENNTKAAIKNETVRKLEIEISNKIQYFKARIEENKKEITKSLNNLNNNESTYTAPLNPTIKEILTETEKNADIFPEYKDRTLQSLIFELDQLSEKDTDKASLYTSRILLKNMALKDSIISDYKILLNDYNTVLKSISKDDNLNKWSK
ncbi:hypothetical protein [Flavobacterium sp. LC2016-01]|uniref:hypothetical protein n=1 Tax=Flavobacterium sp. LC2016-01 TaxID=2675876 RepID=UPI0012BABDB6|nr:hypothetical protein [Flavobacterium sp. LC2016-01]MTH14435.1 hypothetical protein [Flavobacterium sp. LC2016-01]